MKTLILFREGLSGHYFKNLLDNTKQPIGFRVDMVSNLPYNVPDISSDANIICAHPHLINDLVQFKKTFDLTLNIQVYDAIYNACYNNFYKKIMLEENLNFNNWQNNLVYWYDKAFYNIKEYYSLYSQDATNNTETEIINFDHILNENYINKILQKYFDRSLTENQKKIINTYSGLQLPYTLNKNLNSMQEIVDALPADVFYQSPWFAAYCIHCYEKNNNLLESQRKWSIDSVNCPLNSDRLLKISEQY